MLKLDIDGFSEVEVLEYVLVGLEKTREQVTGEIAKIKAQIAGARPAAGTKTPASKASAAPKTTGKRQLSEEARKRIADGQHKRWKNAKKAKKAAEAAAQAPATQEAEPLAEAV